MPTQRIIEVDGMRVTVTRKPIRNMYLRVTPPCGDVVVSAPERLPDAAVADFVRRRTAWVRRQRGRLTEAYERAKRQMEEGLGDGEMPSGLVQWTDDLRRHAKKRLESLLPDFLAQWEPVVGRPPTHITMRLMTSRWGSCTPSTGRIRLNLRLGLMDRRYLEYVLVHELVHLLARGHGEPFQRHMDRCLPDWRQRRRELNRMVMW